MSETVWCVVTKYNPFVFDPPSYLQQLAAGQLLNWSSGGTGHQEAEEKTFRNVIPRLLAGSLLSSMIRIAPARDLRPPKKSSIDFRGGVRAGVGAKVCNNYCIGTHVRTDAGLLLLLHRAVIAPASVLQ